MVDKIKTDVDRLVFGTKNEKKLNFTKNISKPFFIIKIKSSLSASVFTFSIISPILVTTFYVFLDTNM